MGSKSGIKEMKPPSVRATRQVRQVTGSWLDELLSSDKNIQEAAYKKVMKGNYDQIKMFESLFANQAKSMDTETANYMRQRLEPILKEKLNSAVSLGFKVLTDFDATNHVLGIQKVTPEIASKRAQKLLKRRAENVQSLKSSD